MKLVIDTSILIDYLRGGTAWEDFLRTVHRDAELFIPSIVVFELFAGKSTKDSKTAKAIDDFVQQFQQIDVTAAIARRAGELVRDARESMQALDALIAAAALETNAQVVTLNKKHFAKISGVVLYPL